MCGFAGVVAWEDRYRVTRDSLVRMSRCIAHRGPDGEGIWLNHEAEASSVRPQVGLIHRRLAILDLDPRANQPFADDQGRWIVFNGEIYNFRELRAELSKLRPGYAWRTECDTEVLLVAYDVWGEACLERLNGMFTFAVWDENKRELFLARDRMGQKPLYFASPANSNGGAIAFASEIGALRAVPWFDPALNHAGFVDYLQWGYFPAGATAFRWASQLGPARWRHITADSIREGSYFDPNRPIDIGAALDPVAETRRLVQQSVRRRLVSDVPLGCLLSGGMDSSVIAAAMRATVPAEQPVLTFSIGFDDPRYDESEYAAKVAAHLNTQHQRFVVRPDAVEDLARLSEVFGEPFGDSSALPTHYLARETRKHVKVALSGDGGDELFGGYDRYRAMALGKKLSVLPLPVRSLLAAGLWQRLPGTHPKAPLTRLKRFLATLALDPAHRYADTVKVINRWQLDALWPAKTRPQHDAGEWVVDDYNRLLADRDVVQAALATDRVTYLPGDLLTKLDRASMLHALEVRSPFMDHELVQFAGALTTEQLIGGGPKRMLREAFSQDVPEWVFRRRKMGFAIPIGDWFRGVLQPLLRDSLFASKSFAMSHLDRGALQRMVDQHERGKIDHTQRLYALLMLELWWRGVASA